MNCFVDLTTFFLICQVVRNGLYCVIYHYKDIQLTLEFDLPVSDLAKNPSCLLAELCISLSVVCYAVSSGVFQGSIRY